jgi:hypothetical protein
MNILRYQSRPKADLTKVHAIDKSNFMHRRLLQLEPVGGIIVFDEFRDYSRYNGRRGEHWLVRIGESAYTGVKVQDVTLFYPGDYSFGETEKLAWRDIPRQED